MVLAVTVVLAVVVVRHKIVLKVIMFLDLVLFLLVPIQLLPSLQQDQTQVNQAMQGQLLAPMVVLVALAGHLALVLLM
jgi:hypothetical protein